MGHREGSRAGLTPTDAPWIAARSGLVGLRDVFGLKGGPQVVFLLLGQVGGDQLKGDALERFGHLVLDGIAGHQEQGGGAFGHLAAHLIYEIFVDAVV